MRIPISLPSPGSPGSPAAPGASRRGTSLGSTGDLQLVTVTESFSRPGRRHALYTAVYYTLLTASHKHEMFKIQQITAEKSISKKDAGAFFSRNKSPVNKSLKSGMLCCYKNINANYQNSGQNPILSSYAKSSRSPFIINLNCLVKNHCFLI